ncbi:MAG TPA: hypothetical protein VIG99_24880 [Myxococcaceae bacterium]|jgi:hypothetical protein
MRRATVYRRKKQFLVHASSRTTDGAWILWPPCLAVPEGSHGQELGQSIRAALDASRMNVPHPQIWKGLLDPLLALAGVKAWSTFSKDASCVEVEDDGSRITLIPTRNLGPDEGFQADHSRQIVPEPGAAALGAAVRELLPEPAASPG